MKTLRYTRDQLYAERRVDARMARAKIWNKGVVYSTMHPSVFKLDDYLRQRSSLSTKIWQEKVKRRWRDAEFTAYRLKHSTADRFFRKLHLEIVKWTGNIIRILAYGDGKFPPTGPGERAVPTVWWAEKMEKYFRQYNVAGSAPIWRYTREYLSTQSCSYCCQSLLQPVRQRNENGKWVEVRGLKWCPNCAANGLPGFKDRDVNGGRNIFISEQHKLEHGKDACPTHLQEDFEYMTRMARKKTPVYKDIVDVIKGEPRRRNMHVDV